MGVASPNDAGRCGTCGHGGPGTTAIFGGADLGDGRVAYFSAREAVIGGLSLGGFMSLAFHLVHPELVRALVLCDTGPGYRSDDARAGWNRMAHKRAVDLESRGLDAMGSSSEVRATGKYHKSTQGLAHAARGMLAQSDSRIIDHLPDIDVPTIVIVGENDEPFIGASEYMTKKIPGARLEVIPNAGHAANLDNPDHFNRVLRDFLDSLP
jgi:pimeloyl-ACP methyl ester carboxylesterase